jgi:hypothetical protein
MIGKVTADLHMLSADTLQGLQKAGFETEYVSVDKTATPYFVMRNMVYEDRLYLPNMKLLKTELSELEVSPDGTKVDHPIKGSKDIADGVCGAVYTASNNAERNKLLYIANHHKSSANEDVVDLFWGSR